MPKRPNSCISYRVLCIYEAPRSFVLGWSRNRPTAFFRRPALSSNNNHNNEKFLILSLTLFFDLNDISEIALLTFSELIIIILLVNVAYLIGIYIYIRIQVLYLSYSYFIKYSKVKEAIV